MCRIVRLRVQFTCDFFSLYFILGLGTEMTIKNSTYDYFFGALGRGVVGRATHSFETLVWLMSVDVLYVCDDYDDRVEFSSYLFFSHTLCMFLWYVVNFNLCECQIIFNCLENNQIRRSDVFLYIVF